MSTKKTPLDRLKHHVTGAIERGEKTPIPAIVAPKHTPEPWVVGPQYPNGMADILAYKLGPNGETGRIGECASTTYDMKSDEKHANAERIVACVNALAGIEDPAAFVASVKHLLKNQDASYLVREAFAIAVNDQFGGKTK